MSAEQVATMVFDGDQEIEAAVDGIVDVVEVVRTNVLATALFFAGGLSLGLGLGYFVATKRLAKQFDEALEREIADTKEFYAGLNKVDEDGAVMSPMSVLESRHGAAAAEAILSYQGRGDGDVNPPETEEEIAEDDAHAEKLITEARIKSVNLVAEEPDPDAGVHPVEVVKPHNVFTDDNFDLEEEMKYRTPDEPYIITYDEYYANDREFDQQDLTYFEVDDTLSDERDKAIDDVEGVVGTDNLVRFGSGSKDKNKLFIRNERLGIDYEITRSTGSYLEDVLGMVEENPGELKHSDQRDRRRALRSGD